MQFFFLSVALNRWIAAAALITHKLLLLLLSFTFADNMTLYMTNDNGYAVNFFNMLTKLRAYLYLMIFTLIIYGYRH